jgi:hypothetical protein
MSAATKQRRDEEPDKQRGPVQTERRDASHHGLPSLLDPLSDVAAGADSTSANRDTTEPDRR